MARCYSTSFLGVEAIIVVAATFVLKSLSIDSLVISPSRSLCCAPKNRWRWERITRIPLSGWIERGDDSGEWDWIEDDPNYVASSATKSQSDTSITNVSPFASEAGVASTATPRLPSGSYRPKQSLGQNYLKDPNTVAKILRAFHTDATLYHSAAASNPTDRPVLSIVELGPGAGALTDQLVQTYGTDCLQCIEIDERSVQLLQEKHPALNIRHEDVLQVDYSELLVSSTASTKKEGTADREDDDHEPSSSQLLSVVGNLPYYITSQILFALADASHLGVIASATVTMQWEVAQRIIAPTNTKDYGILSVVFQLYADTRLHFKIPPTVFYPQPKVDSALVGLHFIGPHRLRQRLAGVRPEHLRLVVTTAFQQRRKTLRNSLKKLTRDICGGDVEKANAILTAPPLPLPQSVRVRLHRNGDADAFAASQQLPLDWSSKRPEQLSPGQFVELTRLLFGPMEHDGSAIETPLGNKVWRKQKHGSNY